MTTLYLIRTVDDLHEFTQRNPTVTWSSGRPVSTDDFQHRLLPPIALYVNSWDRLSWNPIESGERDLRNEPDRYKLGIISPMLSYGKVFTTFLKHHNAYEAFRYNYKAYRTPFININISRAISNAFTWKYTSQGRDYWVYINNKWQKLMQDLQLPDERIDNFYSQLFIIDGETNDNT